MQQFFYFFLIQVAKSWQNVIIYNSNPTKALTSSRKGSFFSRDLPVQRRQAAKRHRCNLPRLNAFRGNISFLPTPAHLQRGSGRKQGTPKGESKQKEEEKTNNKIEGRENRTSERRKSVKCRVARDRDRRMLSDRECLTYWSTCRARVSTQAGALPCAPSRPPERTHAHAGESPAKTLYPRYSQCLSVWPIYNNGALARSTRRGDGALCKALSANTMDFLLYLYSVSVDIFFYARDSCVFFFFLTLKSVLS